MKTEEFSNTVQEHLSDDENPAFLFSCINSSLLVDIVNGKIHAIELALLELKNRGLNEQGQFVGF